MGWERPEDREEQQTYEAETELRGRMFFLRLTVVLILGLLLGRVIYLQQWRGDDFQTAAIERQLAEITQDAPRGVIFDSNGTLLAENLAQFDVAVTISQLPTEDDARQAVYERVSVLTGVPITNTVAQQQLRDEADSAEVDTAEQLADLFDASTTDTLDLAGIIPELPDSIEEIVQTFNFDPFNPHVIAANVPITVARIVEQESVFLPGISVVAQPARNYPSGEFTSHLIGFMGAIPSEQWVTDFGYERDDRVGLFGLESSMETELSGEKGRRTIEVDATGRETREIDLPTDPVPGFNLHLTLDLELQKIAQEVVEGWLARRREVPSDRTGEDLEVEQAAVVALNPKNGEVLAMVNVPSFDNNRFATEIPVEYYLQLARDPYQPLFNNAIGGQYPPGSVFKVITGAAALQEGIVSPNRLLDTPGAIIIPNRFAPNDPGRAQQFVCWIYNQFAPNEETGEIERGEHGAMNMYTAMSQSCDIYFYKVTGGFDIPTSSEKVDILGINRLQRYANQFGLGRIQGIELPAEAPGNIPTKAWKQQNLAEPWSTGDDYNTSIGQGFVTATPLQIANMAAVIANGGFLYRPTLVHHMTDDKGNIVLEQPDGSYLFASPGEDRIPRVVDASGNPVDISTLNLDVSFDEEGNYIRRPDLLNTVDVDRQFLDVIAEGMFRTNQEGGTGYAVGERFYNAEEERWEVVPWLDTWGIPTAGKSGTAEYCDNIALTRGWCAAGGEIQPSHSWYVAYAPYDDPEIVVASFVYNGEEGSQWSGPIARDVMQAFFEVGQFGFNLDESP